MLTTDKKIILTIEKQIEKIESFLYVFLINFIHLFPLLNNIQNIEKERIIYFHFFKQKL